MKKKSQILNTTILSANGNYGCSNFSLISKLLEFFYFANILCLLVAEKVEQMLYFNDIEKSKQYLSVHCIKTWLGSDTKMATTCPADSYLAFLSKGRE